MMTLNIMNAIDSLYKNPATYKPHKSLLLLAVIDLFEIEGLHDNKVKYNSRLLELFSRRFKQYALTQDRDRPYAPFFHLRNSPFWKLVPNVGQEKTLQDTATIGGPGQLHDLVAYAILSPAFYALLCDNERRCEIKNRLETILKTYITQGETTMSLCENPFVPYINFLHCLDGDCDGALAERQAKEAFFCQIQVSHPLVSEIYETLTSQGSHKHIILTGHAGDGKSTIALELYKRLCKIPADSPLSAGLPSKAELSCNGIKITLVKDLSEWSSREQDEIFAEICSENSRFFLISNTGSLLSLFRRHAQKLNTTDVEMEGRLLTAMDSGRQEELTFGNLHFKVHNLALRDNIDVAMELWRKLTTSEEWMKCTECLACKQCPIYKNLTIISKYNVRVHERLRLMLKRNNEYGGRLTMRQLSAHFSYMLCSGYNCAKMREWATTNTHLKLGDFLFFNHFFGDNADGPDTRASQLRSVQVIREQGFETLQAPCIERYLWLKDPDTVLSPHIPELEDYYDILKKRASGESSNEENMTIDSRSAMARRQVRRMFYFLYEPETDDEQSHVNFDYFKSAFLNSPMLLEYEAWRKNEFHFNDKRTILLNQIFQVLQEQFSGIRLPERGTCGNKNLYITLARRQHDIRQSAQIVLGKIGFNETFILKLENGCVYLVSKKSDYNIRLELPLPFLDYIANRKNGGIGTILQLSYIDRLENLKNKILEFAKLSDDDGMVILKQNAGHELLQQRLRLEQGRLEVSND